MEERMEECRRVEVKPQRYHRDIEDEETDVEDEEDAAYRVKTTETVWDLLKVSRIYVDEVLR